MLDVNLNLMVKVTPVDKQCTKKTSRLGPHWEPLSLSLSIQSYKLTNERPVHRRVPLLPSRWIQRNNNSHGVPRPQCLVMHH